MEDHKKIEAPLKKTFLNLDSINKEYPFGVPDHYFDDLAQEISAKCSKSPEQKPTRSLPAYIQKFLIPFAVAASLIFIVLITTREKNEKQIRTTFFANNSENFTSEYLNYLIDNDELDESLIVKEIIDDDSTITSIQNNKAEENVIKLYDNPLIIADSLSQINITEDDIIQYLLDNDESDDLFN